MTGLAALRAGRNVARHIAGGDARTRVRRQRTAAVGRSWLHHLHRHHGERAGAGVFQPGAPPRLRVQSRRGAARVPQGAAARSRLRDVLLGRGVGARPEHQYADAGGRGRARLRGHPPGAGARRQGDAARAGADRRARDPLHAGPQGRPRAARRGLRRRHGQGRGAVPGRQRHRGAPCRSADGPEPVGLLGAGRREPKPQSAAIVPTLERVLAKAPGPYRRDPPLHPRGRSVRPAAARRALRRPDARRRAGRRASRAHAEPHLLPRRPLPRCARRQQEGGGGRRGLPRVVQSADGRLPARLLSAQRPLRHGVGADVGRRHDGDRRRRKAAGDHPRRGRARYRAGAAGEGCALLRARAVQHRRRRSSRCPTRATTSPT